MKALFHGSKFVIEKPQFGKGKPYNDYGLGFYCTEIEEMAMEWAVSLNSNGFVNHYIIHDENLAVLNLGEQKFCTLHWLSLLLQNREFNTPSGLALEAKDYLRTYFSVDTTSCDAIIGYRADDSYFSFAQDFINGTISLRQLENALKLGKLGEQFVLKSKKAFDSIQFTGYEVAFSHLWYEKKMSRDQKARQEYFDTQRNARRKGDLFITAIMDEEMRSDDSRLR